MTPGTAIRQHTLVGAAAVLAMASAPPASPAAENLIPLSSDALCAKCTGYLLPGRPVASPHTRYRVDSDLPEILLSNGVLYTTKPILPPFETNLGVPVPEASRAQRNIGFEYLDDSLEVFFYHFSRSAEEGETRRIVMLAENMGEGSVTVAPRQISVARNGLGMARTGSVESVLGMRLFTDDFDTPVAPLSIAPGEGAIIGYTQRLNADEDGPDSSTTGFVNGTLRADIEAEDGRRPMLHLSVISIPGELTGEEMLQAAMDLREVGAQSGETYLDLLTPPQFCQVRRVVGTAYNYMWESDVLTLDVAALPGDSVEFPMALPAGQAIGCEAARQTVDLLLHPPYVHPDSIGNYQFEYLVRFVLTNSASEDRSVDIRFGKKDQKIGLAWQIETGAMLLDYDAVSALPATHDWAGLGSPGMTEPRWDMSFLEDGSFEVPAGGEVAVTLRFLILGTSSLPFDLIVETE